MFRLEGFKGILEYFSVYMKGLLFNSTQKKKHSASSEPLYGSNYTEYIVILYPTSADSCWQHWTRLSVDTSCHTTTRQPDRWSEHYQSTSDGPWAITFKILHFLYYKGRKSSLLLKITMLKYYTFCIIKEENHHSYWR